MRIDVFTLFPEVVDHYADSSILGRARQGGLLDLRAHDIRSAATDSHRSVDDAPGTYVDGMLRAIVGFEVRVTSLEGKWKLSQNRSAADVAGVVAGLRARTGDPGSAAVADQMSAVSGGPTAT